MYKNCHIAFTIFCTLIALTGCRKEGDVHGGIIAFIPDISAEVKSKPIDEETLSEFNVKAVRRDKQVEYFTGIAKKVENTSIFQLTDTRYWIPDVPMDFYLWTESAHANYTSIGNRQMTFQFDATGETAPLETMAAILTDMKEEQTNNGVIDIQFKHNMSLIEFELAPRSEDKENGKVINGDDIVIKSLSLGKLATKGTCTISAISESSASWTPDGDSRVEWLKQDYTSGGSNEGLRIGKDIFAGNKILAEGKAESFIIIPGQTLEKIEIQFIEGAPLVEGAPLGYSKEMAISPAINLEPGKRYVFKLAIHSNYAMVTGTKITDWISSGTTDLIIQ